MQELATPEVAARDTTSQAEEEAHSPTPQEESGQTTARCAPVASTLELLEWDKLSAQVAGFAGTASAREMLRRDGLPLPQAREGSERLLAETREAWAIEQRLAKPLELRGFHDLTMPVSLAQKGGVLDGEQLAKLASSLATASTLSKQLRDATADSAASNDDSAQLGLLADLLNAVPLQAELRRELGAAIDEAGEVRDSASPTLGELRYAMREMATSTRRALGAIIAKKSDALATSQPVYRGERFLLQVIAKQKHRNMVKVAPWQRPSSAPAPNQGAPGGPLAARHSQGGPRPLGSQPRPQLLERAASKVADFTAFDHLGTVSRGRCAT